jgi:hypothetical protein
MPKRSTLPRSSSSSTKPRQPISPKDLSPKQRTLVYEILETEVDRSRALEGLRRAMQAAEKTSQWADLLKRVAADPQLPQPKPSRVGYVTELEWSDKIKAELDVNANIVVLDRQSNTFTRVFTAEEAMKEIRDLLLKMKQ